MSRSDFRVGGRNRGYKKLLAPLFRGNDRNSNKKPHFFGGLFSGKSGDPICVPHTNLSKYLLRDEVDAAVLRTEVDFALKPEKIGENRK